VRVKEGAREGAREGAKGASKGTEGITQTRRKMPKLRKLGRIGSDQ